MNSKLSKFLLKFLKNRIYVYFESIKLIFQIDLLRKSIDHLLSDQKRLIETNNHLLSDQNKIKVFNQQILSDQKRLIETNNHLLSDQNKIKVLNQQILNDSVLQHNYLRDKGWYLSFKKQESIDANSNPIPWFTYPAIDFTEKIVRSNFNVFEFGSGNSSLWFSSRCSNIKSVEHDEKWSTFISNKASKNLQVCYRPKLSVGNYDSNLESLFHQYFEFFPDPEYSDDNDKYGLLSKPYLNYCSELYNSMNSYDIIVVDSIARGLSSFLATHFLADNGYIIFDNSDRLQYDWISKYYLAQGFGKIDFWGAGPQNNYKWCTSFFSKRFSSIYN